MARDRSDLLPEFWTKSWLDDAAALRRRIHLLLRREGWKDNIQRVHRLHRLEHLHVHAKAKRKRRPVVRVPLTAPSAPGERWAMDFVHDTLEDGSAFRVFVVVDLFSRKLVCIEPAASFPAERVAV